MDTMYEEDESSPVPRRASGVPGRSFSLAPVLASPRPLPFTKDNRVLINVGGVRYETYKSTLKNLPDTRLAWLTETTAQNADFDPATGEYFFDRHPGVFNMVLNYYRTGKLHAPIDVCGPMYEEELAFWGIDEKQIEPCCWMTYSTHREAQETLKEFEDQDEDVDEDTDTDIAERFGIQEVEEKKFHSAWERIQPKLWTMFEEPKSSKGAQAVTSFSFLFTVVSITTFCMESLIDFRVPVNASNPISPDWSTREVLSLSVPNQALMSLDYVCIAFFTLELIVRYALCPDKLNFFKSAQNWVDILTVIPPYIVFIVTALVDQPFSPGIQMLKTLRLIRIFRIFKLTRQFSGLKIIAHTMRASAKELILLIMFFLISVLIFACLIYYAEIIKEDSRNDFKNIPIGVWWALVTMTTLGYGDIYPRTEVGYVVGGICALVGVLVLALPVPVIVNNFALYYGHAQARLKLPKKKRRAMVNAADMLKAQVTRPGDSLRRVPSLEHSIRSREDGVADSVNSSQNSMDSGIKTGGGPEGPGISVIYTDEIAADHVATNGGPRHVLLANGGSRRKFGLQPRMTRSPGTGSQQTAGDGGDGQQVPRRLSTKNLNGDVATMRRSSMRPYLMTDIEV